MTIRTLSSRIGGAGARFAAALVFLCEPVHALIAGAAPDTPVARIDPNTTTSPWTGVGSVVVNGGVYSGVVVASNFVLTAAHVSGGNASAIQFVLNFGGDQTHTIQAQSVTRYPMANFPYDDLSLIQLTAPIPTGVAIYPLAREPLTSAQMITLVGYGASGNGSGGNYTSSSRTIKRVGGNMIDSVVTTLDSSGRSSLFYLYDFDGPSGAGAMGGGTLGNAVETLVAGGDSGSPAFLGTNGNYRLVGINTFTANPVAGQPNNSNFGMLGGGILLTRPEFLDWIDATIAAAGPAPVDIPTLPEWALIFGVVVFGTVALRSRAFAG